MPIQATFTADFTKWNEALRNASAGLKSLELAGKGVAPQLERMAKSFAGVEIQKQANLAVAAIKAIGKEGTDAQRLLSGASKLTANEQAKLNATLTEALAKYKALGQEAPKDMVALAEATKAAEKSTGSLAQSTKDAAQATASSSISLKGLVAGYVAGLATFEAAKHALGGIVDFLGSSLESYGKAEAATKRLTTALQATGNSTPKVIGQMNALATEFQNTTTFSDDLITEMEALFTQLGKVGPDQMKTALTAATDLAEGLGIDLEDAVKAVAKATEGSTTALHKLAPSLSEAALKGGDLAEIAGEIEKHFGGQAQAQLDTYQGRIKQLANEWDNVKEAIGGALANDQAIKALLRGITDGLHDASNEGQSFSLSQLLMNQLVGEGNVVFATLILKLDQYATASNNAATAVRLLNAAKKQSIDDSTSTASSGLPSGFVADLEAARKAMAAFTDEQRKEIQAGLALGKNAADIVKALNDQHDSWKLTETAVKLYDDALKKANSTSDKARKALDDQRDALNFVKDELLKVADALGKVEEKSQALDFADEMGDLKAQLLQVENRINKVSAEETEWIEGTSHLLVNKSTVVKQYFEMLVKEQEKAAKAAHLFRDALTKIGEDIPNILAQAFVNHASFEDTVKALGTKIGADLGEAIGGAVGGPIGAAIGEALGSLLGPLLDKLIKTRGEQLQSSVLHDFGVAIGEDLGNAIADSAINEFKGSFTAAQIGNLDKIISAGGGITIQNLGKLEDRLHDVFALLSTGELTAAQAQDVLNKNFQTFVDFLGGDVNPALKEIIRLNKEFGTQSKAILDFVAKNADRAASGFNKIANNFLTLVTGFQSGSDDMKRLQDAINGVADSTKKVAKEAPEAHRGIEELKRAANSGFAPEFLSDVQKQLGRIGPLAQAAFGALLDGGKSVTEALAELAPGLQQIEKVLKATGQQADGFLGQIIGWEDIVSKNKELFDILSGVDDMLHGLNNAGALTQDAFASLTATISDTFDQLVIQGVKGADAIMLMQPQLQEVWELQKDFGFSVDDATQKLLDQAVAAGEVGEKHRSVQEQMLDLQKQELAVLTAIGTAFGVTIPNDISKTGNAFDKLGNKIDDAIAKIPENVHIPVKFDIPELPDGVYPGTGYHGDSSMPFSSGGLVPFLPKAFANGGMVPSAAMLKRIQPVYAAGGFFTPRGTDTVPAMLSPGEFVVSRRGVQSAGMPALRSINNGVAPVGGGNVTTINVYVDNKLDTHSSQVLAQAIAPHIPGVVANGGATIGNWKRMTKALAK